MASKDTLIIAMGSNDSGKNTLGNITKAIQLGQDQGYKNIIVVPPNPTINDRSNYNQALNGYYDYKGSSTVKFLTEAQMNEYGGWKSNDQDHLNNQTYATIARNYPDATVIGDSNAEAFKEGGWLSDVYGYSGKTSDEVLNNVDGVISSGDFPAGNSNSSEAKAAAEQTAANANYAQRQKDAAANPKNSADVTKEDLQKQTGLEEWEYGYIENNFCKKNTNYYFLTLVFLVYGFDYKTVKSKIDSGQDFGALNENMLKSILLMKDEPYISSFLWKTPAYKKGSFTDQGSYGAHAVNANNALSNPITGPGSHGSAMTGGILEKMIPGANKSIEDLCTKIRTHSWLALPKGNFGSLQRIVSGINASIEAFQDMIHDIYQGAVIMIQKAYAYLNGQMVKMQKALLSFISENIIDLDLLCLILDTIQVVLDDVNFISSLFNMNGSFMTYLNTFQQYMNIGSQFVSNPFSTASQFLPSNVKNIIDTVNQIGADPNGFLADKLNNYGQSYILNALQGNIVGALVNKYGPQYASITPLGNILSKAGSLYTHFAPAFPAESATMGPNIYTGYNGVKRDANGNPLGSNRRTKLENVSDAASYIFTDTFNNTTDKLKDDANRLSEGLGQVGTGVSDTLSEIGTGISDTFTKAKNFVTGEN
jgi:hypothetical protein